MIRIEKQYKDCIIEYQFGKDHISISIVKDDNIVYTTSSEIFSSEVLNALAQNISEAYVYHILDKKEISAENSMLTHKIFDEIFK